MVMGERICNLCMHRCRLNDGQTGRCRARKNADGKVICGNYGKITSLALDPIEKTAEKIFTWKPHFVGGELWMQFVLPFLSES